MMQQPFDLKGASFTIPMLSLRGTDMETIGSQLTKKVCQAPSFFRNAPLVVNLGYLPEPDQVDLPRLLTLVEEQGFIPVGITNGSEGQQQQAKAMHLAVLTTRGSGREQEKKEDTEKEEHEQQEAVPSGDTAGQQSPAATVIADPIRSGQRVVVEHGDLIVLASVGSGAEVMAAGNIHIYGTLRGRAFAGNTGNNQARIFCQQLEAELVAVAGIYMVNEKFPDSLRGHPVHIQLQTERLRITPL
jgi:septum site-determining protein MinC